MGLPDVDVGMMFEVQKRSKAFKSLQQLLIQQIRQECQKATDGWVANGSVLLV